MLVYEGCNVLKGSPFWVLFVTVVILAHITPLIIFYAKDFPPTNEYTLHIGHKAMTIPSISRTWRTRDALFTICLCLVINVMVYTICFIEVGNIVALDMGLLLAGFVFCFNDENGPIAKVHAFFAFGFFAYLLWCVYALRIYLNYQTWWWPYIPMSICFLVMFVFSITESLQRKENQYKHWPWWVSLAEHLFILSFEIYLITIT